MRALRKDEIGYMRGDLFFWGIMTTRQRQKLVGLERRLMNLGLLRVDVPAIKNWQRTIYCLSAKGMRVRMELRRIDQFNQVLGDLLEVARKGSQL